MPKTDDEKDREIKSLNIPGDVRDQLAEHAKKLGLSSSAIMRQIVDDYVSGRLDVQPEPDPTKIVRTSVWMPKSLWAQFVARTEREGVPTQLVMRAWLKEHDA